MSTPYKGEMGDWNNDQFNSNCQSVETSDTKCNSYLIERNHGEFFRSIENLNMVDRNQKLTQKAISNIQRYPIKYVRNIINNVSRLFYNIPSSYFYQRDITIMRLIPNSIGNDVAWRKDKSGIGLSFKNRDIFSSSSLDYILDSKLVRELITADSFKKDFEKEKVFFRCMLSLAVLDHKYQISM